MKSIDYFKLYHRDFEPPAGRYYVYTHKNPLTQKVFYVGSAQGNLMRAYEFDKHRSQSWKNEVISFGGICNLIVEIVEYCENPIIAQQKEFQLIDKLRKVGEAYCNYEGDVSFKRKYPKLKYIVEYNGSTIEFSRKTDLYIYCIERFGISKRIVKLILDNGGEYRNGLKIKQVGKEHS